MSPPPALPGTICVVSPKGAGIVSVLFGVCAISAYVGITHPLSTASYFSTWYSAAFILNSILSLGETLVIIYCLGVPETGPPSSASPTIVKTTSPLGAELKALDTVTELALNEDIV